MKSVLQITLGILLAGLVMLLVRIAYSGYIEYRVTQGLNEIALKQKQAEATRLEAIKIRQKAELQLRQQAKQEAARKSLLAKQKAKELKRKNDAWRAYYTVPDICKSYESDEQMVNCVNHKADAKGKFEKAYASGDLILLR
ncbi:hypothetical protein [Shewanella sp. 4_MG-2023]|uniref:hypothetical protein n=1 Tax=Shewanella sp. 4_MG-2023 TaxID=3062652 RepID=UPI0026E1334F|nr:hypothetical protein [Shewanella sp. 4_MG-2023]MDO6677700.1 hypothetical protein [Shewanella sp. 4_MG-2023]